MNPGVSGDSTSIGFFDAIAMGALSCSLVHLLASSASRPFLALLEISAPKTAFLIGSAKLDPILRSWRRWRARNCSSSRLLAMGTLRFLNSDSDDGADDDRATASSLALAVVLLARLTALLDLTLGSAHCFRQMKSFSVVENLKIESKLAVLRSCSN